jgi:tetratricopeptide (TPR) repeat protein
VLFKRLLYLSPLLLLFSCSTQKNTVVSRAFHNLTARYNGYYYSCENIKDGIYKIERNHKENYEKVLPVYIYPSPEKAKNTFPEFDKAIKKSSLTIQRHAIKDSKGNEVASAGKWIDDNWINIGVAHVYKREFFSGIEAFEYVIRTYTKSDDKYSAMLWLIRANNEIGSVSSSEPILSFLKNEKKLPPEIKKEIPVVYADYYMRRGQNTEAVAKLLEATRNTNLFFGIDKKRRARYSFIIAQLSELNKENNRAILYYKRTINLKPNYEMIFYSKIKMARLIDVKKTSSEKTKKDLLKMTKEFKNSDYYDVIYYTLGEIEEKEKNVNQAVSYYKKSVQTSVNNPSQKALSYLRLGEIKFDLTQYQPAEAYYDSAIVTLPKDHPDYNNILARKKTLESLVGHIRTIYKEDSLQKIAKMTEAQRNAYIDKIIEFTKKEIERKKQEKELALQNGDNTSGTQLPGRGDQNMPGSSGAAFYFYNPNTVALGIADFTRKWGNRKLEDNWRRINKSLILEETEEETTEKGPAVKDTSGGAAFTREFYMTELPLTDSLLKKSNDKIIKAYYMMGSLYKEELNNTKKSVAALEELNSRFPDNKYTLNSYYILYRLFLEQKNQAKAEYYKNKILEEYPDSEFAQLINNPAYAEQRQTQKSEVESYYAKTYRAFNKRDYPKAYDLAKEGISKFGKNDYRPKFEFIKAVSSGKISGIDTLEKNLRALTALFPDAEVTPLANEILESIKKQRNPDLFKDGETNKEKKETFEINKEAEHFIVAVTPDDARVSETFKSNISAFNTLYYSEKTFNITANLFGDKQMVVIKSFPNAKEAINYYDNLLGDPDVFSGNAKKELIMVFPIMRDNLPILYSGKNTDEYKTFFQNNYKK